MKQDRIVIYTCATGNRDPLRDDQNTEDGAFHAFVDQPIDSVVWQQFAACEQEPSPRRNARKHKILAHEFVDCDYSLWQDANVALKVPVSTLVDAWLDDCDVAVFLHRTRNCTYQEAAVCREKGLDDGALIERQIARYRKAGLPAEAGLAETSVVLRRHNQRVAAFNRLWWDELAAYSVRDQLSFMYAARATGVRFRLITPTKFIHPYFSMTVRPAGIEAAASQSPGDGDSMPA